MFLVQESIGVALMMASESKKHLAKERDTVCLSLDGLRRIARLFCTLGEFVFRMFPTRLASDLLWDGSLGAKLISDTVSQSVKVFHSSFN